MRNEVRDNRFALGCCTLSWAVMVFLFAYLLSYISGGDPFVCAFGNLGFMALSSYVSVRVFMRCFEPNRHPNPAVITEINGEQADVVTTLTVQPAPVAELSSSRVLSALDSKTNLTVSVSVTATVPITVPVSNSLHQPLLSADISSSQTDRSVNMSSNMYLSRR